MLDFFPLANIGRILLIHHIQFTNYVELFMRAYIVSWLASLRRNWTSYSAAMAIRHIL